MEGDGPGPVPAPAPDRVLLHFWSAGSLLQRRTLFDLAHSVSLRLHCLFIFFVLFSLPSLPSAVQEFYLLANFSQTCAPGSSWQGYVRVSGPAAGPTAAPDWPESVGTKSLTGKNQS